MAKVDINIIKEWFKNFKKPNQDQFWSWLDSFRHKDDKIPMADVENLNQTLIKKADLVGGVVPESQLPFTINSNEVIAIGLIETTINNVKVNVHVSGENKVRINGQILTRTFYNNLPYTPVTTGNKFLRVVAKNAPGLFFLKESEESDEPQEPELEAGELHVRLILVTPDGNFVDPEVLNGFKEKSEDNWRTVFPNKLGNYNLPYTDTRTCFSIEMPVYSTASHVIQTIDFATETTRDVLFLIKNNTLGDVVIPSIETEGLSKGFADNTPYTIPSLGAVFAKYKASRNVVEILKTGNAGITSVTTDATLEGVGSSANPLKLSATKVLEIGGKENTSNKITSWNALPNNENYPSEKLVKDSLDALVTGLTQPIKTVTISTTIDNSYHNAIVRVESNVTITIPNNLRLDFNAVFEAIGSVTATFLEGPSTVFSAPFGKVLKDNSMCNIYKSSANTYRLNGGLLPA